VSDKQVDIEKLAERVYKLMLEEARQQKARGQVSKQKKRG
jgi:hypothetical protein